jgi:DNA-binding transcriptional MerR regulator
MIYTIKSACALLDVPADTLRKWERRYRLVAPRRSKNAYRGYDDADLKRLSVFARARIEGVPGPEAARRAANAGSAAAPREDPALQLAAESAIDSLDRARLVQVCARAEAESGIAGALASVWIPLLSKLGERAIELKGLEIAKEHFAVAVLRERILDRGAAPGRPRVALASPEGELHEIGMLTLAQELRDRKVPCLYLGPNLPVESLCAALSRARLDRAILCVSRRLSRPDLKAMVRRIRRKNPGTILYIGGPASLAHANLIAQLGGIFLGANLELGVDKLVRSIRRPDPRRAVIRRRTRRA